MSRSIFEDVGDGRPEPGATPGEAEAQKRRNRRRVAVWLFALAGMVALLILIGGLTRLTDSGLSITNWRPFIGWLPPFSETGWLAAFDAYRQTTEAQVQNAGMTLDQFKTIYYWEWGHRVWAQVIGLAFIIPLVIFWRRGEIPVGWTRRILLVGALGGLQAAIGWWMVRSGLEEGQVDVSPVRLAVHLGVAFTIFGLLLWYGFSLLREEWDLLQARRRREKPLFIFAAITATLLALQILMGAIVAGLDAGKIFVDWPLMDGSFYPPNEPFAPFSSQGAAQFMHRLIGYALVIAAAVFWWRARRSSFARSRRWATIFAGVLLVQMAVGIATLLHAAPLAWGLLHQFTAVLLFAVMIHMKHQFAFPKEEKIAA